MSDGRLRRSVRASVALIALAVAVPMGLSGTRSIVYALDEGELLRSIKTDVFDQRWSDVLENCDQFIEEFPRSQALPRAYFYRAQALESLRRPGEAIEAYTQFLKRFPSETGAIKEDAILKRITLARQLYQRGDTGNLWAILEGMDMKGYPRTYAAIEASKLEHRPAQKKALPILQNCARNETEDELKNECVVAILRFEPEALPETDTGSKKQTPQVKLIKVEVFDYRQNKVTVTVNLPIAFAELALESLSQHYREAIQRELFPDAPSSMPNLDEFWNALKEGGPQTILEIDNENERIRVWIE